MDTEEPGGLQSVGLPRVRHNSERAHCFSLSIFCFYTPKQLKRITLQEPDGHPHPSGGGGDNPLQTPTKDPLLGFPASRF